MESLASVSSSDSEQTPVPSSSRSQASGLNEICKGLMTKSIIILIPNNTRIPGAVEFTRDIHQAGLKVCVFDNADKYLDFIASGQQQFMDTISLIFAEPSVILDLIRRRDLAHRLNLYMFFWNKKNKPIDGTYSLAEPIRAAIITRPRPNVLIVFYNQATPSGNGQLTMVNWYDALSLGLFRVPLLPSSSAVYRNFNGRVLCIPVIHSPPWHFVEYLSEDMVNGNRTEYDTKVSCYDSSNVLRVVGGRDFHLLKLLAKKMNFKFRYMDPVERTQGAVEPDSSENLLFSGALGSLQHRESDMLLGDITITWERNRAVEFSFFTLVDSGAFVTQAPKRLNEALILVRPFHWKVWPLLLFTILFSGPAFYLIIAVPFLWQDPKQLERGNCVQNVKHQQLGYLQRQTKQRLQQKNFYRHHTIRSRDFIDEMRYETCAVPFKPTASKVPANLFEKCMWFTLALFLKQSCNELCTSKRVKFLSTILWLSATYVLSDVYSAQLTSQLARPAREPPINTLHKLETAMRLKGYQLYVERQSSSLSTLENGMEIFKRLYNLMEQQNDSTRTNGDGSLVSSVEEGINLVMYGSSKAIMGGKETLLFNMKRYGIQKFQMSENLYTRYSAVAIQSGCSFIESLNEVIIHLFEGGILDKMTHAEYEKMFKISKVRKTRENSNTQNNVGLITVGQFNEESKLQAINLRTFEGAFIVLGIGYLSAAAVLLCEQHLVILKRGISKIKHVICTLSHHLFSLTIKIVFYCKEYLLND